MWKSPGCKITVIEDVTHSFTTFNVVLLADDMDRVYISVNLSWTLGLGQTHKKMEPFYFLMLGQKKAGAKFRT